MTENSGRDALAASTDLTDQLPAVFESARKRHQLPKFACKRSTLRLGLCLLYTVSGVAALQTICH